METKKTSLLKHIEHIVELAEKKGFSDDFFTKTKTHLDFVADALGLTPVQAALFAFFLNRSDDQSISTGDIADAIKCSKIKIIQHMNDIDEIVKKKLLVCKKTSQEYRYRVPFAVIDALRKDEPYTPPSNANLSIIELFSVVEILFELRGEDELTFDALTAELKQLVENNAHLIFCQKIKNLTLDDDYWTLMMLFFHLFVNNQDDMIGFHDIEFLYDYKSTFRAICESLKDGYDSLLEDQFIENTNSDGFGDRESFKLTDKAKSGFLGELNLKEKTRKSEKELIISASLPVKKLFYNEKEQQQIDRLVSLLREENFKSVQERLAASGMRTGFACLFSGPPGTGKTETVYQIARETGRNIMMVDISEIKSCWFGESEKQIKAVFDRYRGYVKNSDVSPILLFNEADAVIGKRKELGAANRAVDQTENTIQNIILQELETLSGILIATTNLVQNMDKAFERRFLFKIEFAKPCLDARTSIWRSMMPALNDEEACSLASRFDFSGGQIENISRKRTVNSVISGEEPSLDTLISFCHEEMFVTRERAIGFSF